MSVIQIEPENTSHNEAEISATVRGLTPILMHRPGSMMPQTEEVERRAKKKIPTPQEECEMGVYRDDNGLLFVPSRWVIRSIVESGKAFQNPQNRRQSMKNVLAAAVTPPPVLGFPLWEPGTENAIKNYEVDIQRVVVQRNAVMRARPRIDNWEVFLNLSIDLDVLAGDLDQTGKFLLDVLSYAGSKQGYGDNRPERGGSYGKFQVVEFSISDEL